MHREKHFYFKMLITFEPNVAQRSVASQNDHKSKACLPEASNTAFTIYRRLKRRLRRLYEAPFWATFFLAPHSSNLNSEIIIRTSGRESERPKLKVNAWRELKLNFKQL